MSKNKLNRNQLFELTVINAQIIAHDIRSPLSTIAMGIRRLLTECANSTTTLETMDLCVNKINEIINNSLKTINNTQQIYQGELISNGFVITNILDNLAKNKLSYLFDAPELSHLHIDIEHNFKYLGNPISMDQIITNLISNSLHQIREKLAGEIFISSSKGEKFNYLHIKDTAGGVTQEIVSKIFNEKFTTKEDGHGIGLDFCKKTLKLFGGNITANLVDTDKIEFILSLPKIDTEKE